MKKIIASNPFLKFKKHSTDKLQLQIDNQVKKIIDNPKIGQLKQGDLKGIRVYKFKYKTQQYLLSYESSRDLLYLYFIDSHENYYKKHKNYMKVV